MKRPHTALPFLPKTTSSPSSARKPGKVGTREIARAFGMKNADRAELKRMLRELADEGKVERRRKKLHHPGTLPHVVLADISARDGDGELIAAADRMGRGRARPGPENPRADPAPCPPE